MTDFVQEFTESAEKVARMMDLINKVTGAIQPIVIDINGVHMALTLQPIMQKPEAEVADAHAEEVAEEAAPAEEAEIQ